MTKMEIPEFNFDAPLSSSHKVLITHREYTPHVVHYHLRRHCQYSQRWGYPYRFGEVSHTPRFNRISLHGDGRRQFQGQIRRDRTIFTSTNASKDTRLSFLSLQDIQTWEFSFLAPVSRHIFVSAIFYRQQFISLLRCSRSQDQTQHIWNSVLHVAHALSHHYK